MLLGDRGRSRAIYVIGIAGVRTVDRRPLIAAGAHLTCTRWSRSRPSTSIAHYFSFLLYNGQAIGYLASDPLGKGWDLFGTADSAIDYGVISATGIWYVQVGVLVPGTSAA